MEKLSRVKKYEELRKSIELDNNVNASLHNESNIDSDKVLKEFDSSILKKIDVDKKDETSAKRAKLTTNNNEGKSANINDTFTNEYLDDFMREVREYNIRKGNRDTEDTHADILYQLNESNRSKRSHYIEELQEDDAEEKRTILNKNAIALEVANLLKEEALESEDEEENECLEEADKLVDDGEIEKTLNIMGIKGDEVVSFHHDAVSDKEVPDDNDHKSKLKDGVTVKKVIQPIFGDYDVEKQAKKKKIAADAQDNRKVLEETQQLRVKMDKYEDELTGLSDDMNKSNRTMKVVLCCLIILFLVILGFIIFLFLKAGGRL